MEKLLQASAAANRCELAVRKFVLLYYSADYFGDVDAVGCIKLRLLQAFAGRPSASFIVFVSTVHRLTGVTEIVLFHEHSA